MLQKNKDREERRQRQTWVGFKPRKEKTKQDRLHRQNNKHKKPLDEN